MELVSTALLVKGDDVCDRAVCGSVQIANREMLTTAGRRILRNDFMRRRSEQSGLRYFLFMTGIVNDEWLPRTSQRNHKNSLVPSGSTLRPSPRLCEEREKPAATPCAPGFNWRIVRRIPTS